MSDDIVEKIRRGRERRVEVGRWAFTIRRPTPMQMTMLRDVADNEQRARRLLGFVVGWEGVRAKDVYPGGADEPLGFAADVFYEWVSDDLDTATRLIAQINEAYEQHVAQLADAEKK